MLQTRKSSAAVAIRDHNDETALCQLGAAAILLWSELPRDLRTEMIHLVSKIDGIRKLKPDDFNERFARLIETNVSSQVD